MTPYHRLAEPAILVIAVVALAQPPAPPGLAPGLARADLAEAPADRRADVTAAVLQGQTIAAQLNLPLDYRSAIAALDARRCRRHPVDAVPVALLLHRLAKHDHAGPASHHCS